MIRNLFGGIAVLIILSCGLAVAQEKVQQEKVPQEQMKQDMKMGQLRSLSCDSVCGFMVRSHDEKELMSVMKSHAEAHHKMTLTDKQMLEMMKTEAQVPVKREAEPEKKKE